MITFFLFLVFAFVLVKLLARRFGRVGPVLVAALVVFACANVTVHPNGDREVQTFGAVKTTVAADGMVTTESGGVSENLVGFLTHTVDAAANAFLAFFNRALAAQAPPQVVVMQAPAQAPVPAAKESQ